MEPKGEKKRGMMDELQPLYHPPNMRTPYRVLHPVVTRSSMGRKKKALGYSRRPWLARPDRRCFVVSADEGRHGASCLDGEGGGGGGTVPSSLIKSKPLYHLTWYLTLRGGWRTGLRRTDGFAQCPALTATQHLAHGPLDRT